MKNTFEKICPKCNSIKAYVKDSRPTISETGAIITRRRRVCSLCKFRWTTYEITAEEYKHLRSANTQIGYNLIKECKDKLEKWLNADIDGINRK